MSEELKDILIADIALTIAFALLLTGGISNVSNNQGQFLFNLEVSIVAMPLSFILHEYMHKIVAQHFGAIAAFQKSDQGILITLITGAFGFLIGLPGATVIYAHNFTKKEEGYVSLAGPITNFAVFIALFLLALSPPLYAFSKAISIILFINIWLAFFNMLPIYPLDGNKVLRWNKIVYVVVLAIIFAMLFILNSGLDLIINIIVVLVFALAISFFYKNFLFR